MFDNISQLRIQKGVHNESIVMAMCSSEGEVMDYRNPVIADGRIEDWMTNVLNEMRRTNRLITKEAVYFYCENERTRHVYGLSFTAWRQGRLNQWAHWARAHPGPPDFFLLEGPPTVCKKGKVFPYSLPSVGPGADPGVQAVSPQVT